jgi:hypothetical protein
MIRLSLAVQGLDPDRLTPFEAEGVEELSSLYFDVRCADSTLSDPLGPDLLGRRATLSMKRRRAAVARRPRVIEPLPEPDVAAALGKSRDLLAKAKLPPAVQQVVNNESDPTVIFNALTDYMEKTPAALQAKYPK